MLARSVTYTHATLCLTSVVHNSLSSDTMISGLTLLDCFEKVAQVMYSAQLLLTPAKWITDNFVDESIASNPTVLAMTNVYVERDHQLGSRSLARSRSCVRARLSCSLRI